MTSAPTPRPAAARHPTGASRPRNSGRWSTNRGGDPAQTQQADARTYCHSVHSPGRVSLYSTTVQRTRLRQSHVDTLICDIDNVIILYDPAVPPDIERRHNLPEGSLLDTLLEWPTSLMASIGAIDYAQWLRYARQTLPAPAVDEWLAYRGSLNQPLVDLLHSTKGAGLRLFLLANGTGQLHDHLTHHQLNGLPDGVYVSADIGYAKPDAGAYEHVLHDTAADPAATIYVDDIPSWVHTSRQLGMRGHLYLATAQLRHDLAREGVAI